MMDAISLESFTKHSHVDGYRDYLDIKFQVFVTEQLWTGLCDSEGTQLAREDPFDEHGRFLLARSMAGRPIGVVRGVSLREGFPHKDLLQHHLASAAVMPLRPLLCTLNGLAVLPEYRRHQYRVVERSWTG